MQFSDGAIRIRFAVTIMRPSSSSLLAGNNSGAFYTFLLHNPSHVYIDLIAPIIYTAFSPHYNYLQQALAVHRGGSLYPQRQMPPPENDLFKEAENH